MANSTYIEHFLILKYKMQGTDLPSKSNLWFSILLKDISTQSLGEIGIKQQPFSYWTGILTIEPCCPHKPDLQNLTGLIVLPQQVTQLPMHTDANALVMDCFSFNNS